MVSLVFFLGFLLEDRVACNAASPAQFRASTITQGSHNKVGPVESRFCLFGFVLFFGALVKMLVKMLMLLKNFIIYQMEVSVAERTKLTLDC